MAMTLSLRSKFFFLVVAAVTLAAVPIIFLTYHELRDISLQREQESFANIVVLMEDNVSSRYLDLLSVEIADVLRRKDQLRTMAQLAQTTWMDLSTVSRTDQVHVFANWSQQLQATGLYVDLLEKSGSLILSSPVVHDLVSDLTHKDVKGRPIASMLEPRSLPAEGEFAVFALNAHKNDQSTDKTETALVFFFPIPNQEALVILAVLLSDIIEEAGTKEQHIIRGVQDKFTTLHVHKNGFIALVSGAGAVLAYQGHPFGQEPGRIPREALEHARSTRQTDFLYTDSQGKFEATMLRIAYFKALDWFIVAAVPQSDIEAPARVLTQHLAGVAVFSAVLSVLGMLLLTARLIKPLQTLTEKIRILGTIDLTKAAGSVHQEYSPLVALATELPVGQGDEVGTLAQAFGDMGRALDQNIRTLTETTAVKERMQGELSAARDIQMGILPSPHAPRHADLEVAAFLEPAKEVGGDLYDFFVTPDGRQALIIGDVSDKGVPAALFMSMTVTLVRYALSMSTDLGAAMASINDRLGHNNPGCMFVTLFIGLFDPHTGVLEFVNGGHCPPLISDAAGQVRTLTQMSGPVVGAMPGLPYQGHKTVLGPGEACLLYSDGITEAMNTQQDLFGDEQLAEVLATCAGQTPAEILDGVFAAVLAHRGTAAQSDDITMLCWAHKRQGSAG